MSVKTIQQVVNLSLREMWEYLNPYGVHINATSYKDIFLLKFDPQTQSSHPAVNQLRGVIFDAQKHEVLSMGCPVPIEYKDQPEETQEYILDHIHLNPYTVQEAMDGTLIRLWWFEREQKWVLSTNSILDAYQATWMGSVSFGELFDDSIQHAPLNPENHDYIYLFSLCTPHNVIVVNHQENQIYHLTTYDRRTLKEITTDAPLPIIKKPATLDLTIDQVVDLVGKSQETPVSSAGYLVLTLGSRFRFENLNYTKARQMRGNSNDVEECLLTQNLQGNIAEFLQYYPIYQEVYYQMSCKLDRLIDHLFSVYIRRYVNHECIWVPQPQHWFLLDLHAIYCRDRNRITRETVHKLFFSRGVGNIMSLLNSIDED